MGSMWLPSIVIKKNSFCIKFYYKMLYNVRTEISFICYSVSPAVVISKTPVLKY